MLIWFDVNTPKQALLFTAMGKKIAGLGFEHIITAREYDVTVGILHRLNQDFILVGKHGGGTLKGKLVASIEKMKNVVDFFDQNDITPDLAVHFASPEAARIAFGLGIKNICVHDTPHSIYTIKLSIPFSDYLIIPSAIPKVYYTSYISEHRIYPYNGVDALEWINNVRPDISILNRLGIAKGDRIVVFRPEEGFASYYLKYTKGKPLTTGMKILKHILNKHEDVKVVFLGRYREHFDAIKDSFNDRVIIPKETVLGLDLYPKADIVITGGGTMALEAALLGIPSLTYFPSHLYLPFFLKTQGFPIEHITILDAALKYIDNVLKDPLEYRVKTDNIIKKLETPSSKIVEIIKNSFKG